MRGWRPQSCRRPLGLSTFQGAGLEPLRTQIPMSKGSSKAEGQVAKYQHPSPLAVLDTHVCLAPFLRWWLPSCLYSFPFPSPSPGLRL